MYVQGKDLNGRPLIHISLGLGPLNSSSSLQLLLLTLENAIASMKSTAEFCVIIDCANFKKQNLPTVETLKIWMKSIKDHYPSFLGKLFIVNVENPMIWVLWKAVSLILSSQTKQKVQLLKRKEISKLTNHISKEDLRAYF
mmetsp:Transcript_24681/g.31925  ORF Transcript_24681/g.31925 Transcript_24681/m.31925 type:complete len:141 (-) Transcript_24681:236-658(-)